MDFRIGLNTLALLLEYVAESKGISAAEVVCQELRDHIDSDTKRGVLERLFEELMGVPLE